MHVHYVTLPFSFLNPPIIQLGGVDYPVHILSVQDYLKFSSIGEMFSRQLITEEEKVMEELKLFLPTIDIQYFSPKLVKEVYPLCLETLDISSLDKLINPDGVEVEFKAENKKKVDTRVAEPKERHVYIDLLFQVSSLVRFYGFSHEAIMDMPYVWFLIYLKYKSKIEANEDCRNLFVSASAQSTDVRKAGDRLRAAAQLPADILNTFSAY